MPKVITFGFPSKEAVDRADLDHAFLAFDMLSELTEKADDPLIQRINETMPINARACTK